MPLPHAIAWSSSVNCWTVMTGPKISRWIISSSCWRSATTVGSRKKPGRSGSLPPVTIFAFDGARSRKPSTRSRWRRGVQRAEVRVGGAQVAHHVALGLLGEAVDDVVVDLAGGEHARRRGAVLAGVVVAGAGDRLEHRVEVDVVEDDDRRLAAELEVHALERLRGVLGDPLAGVDRAGERDDVDAVVLDDRGARVVAARDDVQHALREDVGRELGHLQRVMGVVGAGLRTIVQPAASAGPIFHTAIISG